MSDRTEGGYTPEDMGADKDVQIVKRTYTESELAALVDASEKRVAELVIGEIHRHWLFLKYERGNGGNYEHLNTRMVEAEYLEGRIRVLLAGRKAGTGKDTQELPEPGKAWLIYFEENGLSPEVFLGVDSEGAARRRFKQCRQSFSCNLFMCISEAKPAADASR